MTAAGSPSDSRRAQLEGLAAIATTVAEMGGSQEEIVAAVGDYMLRLGMATAEDVRDVLRAISTLPQPLDEPAEVRERKRPIEDVLGVTSPEQELTAAMRAIEALRAFAEQLEVQSDS